ncbi:unnamed protein product [Somion occarium]|uniref:Uncharacterized protein n=1 Tax=Somion occarium TaxID=3059160 RepID=A0ABP1CHR3_9APHY
MSDRIARKHHNQTNRAQPRNGADRKVVYKSVLENPFRVSWPTVPANVQNMLLARVIQLLDGMSHFHRERQSKSRAQKKLSTGLAVSAKSRRQLDIAENQTNEMDTSEDLDATHVPSDIPSDESNVIAHGQEAGSLAITRPPQIIQHLTIGINEVTKGLELRAKSSCQTLSADIVSCSERPKQNFAQLVLVCCGDVNPPILISHLPQLVASCNSTRTSQQQNPHIGCIWLVPLPRGAEESLAEALGLRRVSVLSIHSTAPNFSDFLPLLSSVPILSAPWVQPKISDKPCTLTPTHIKQLRTSAPKNMREAKEKRSEAKAAAKARKKAQRSAGTSTKSLPLIHRDVIMAT